MPKDIVIVGAGGLGREVLWLLQELNSRELIWNIKGFVDDNKELQNSIINDFPVLGSVDWLIQYSSNISVVCCIAKPSIRQSIIVKLQKNAYIDFPNIIAEGVRYSKRVQLGIGNIICLATTMTVDINLGNFNIINPACTIGHDVRFNNYITLYPGVNISGNVKIDDQVEIGTGAQVIQGLKICGDVFVGAGSVVIRDIFQSGTYVGAPSRRIN